jgi:hypothetical protein
MPMLTKLWVAPSAAIIGFCTLQAQPSPEA